MKLYNESFCFKIDDDGSKYEIDHIIVYQDNKAILKTNRGWFGSYDTRNAEIEIAGKALLRYNEVFDGEVFLMPCEKREKKKSKYILYLPNTLLNLKSQYIIIERGLLCEKWTNAENPTNLSIDSIEFIQYLVNFNKECDDIARKSDDIARKLGSYNLQYNMAEFDEALASIVKVKKEFIEALKRRDDRIENTNRQLASNQRPDIVDEISDAIKKKS